MAYTASTDRINYENKQTYRTPLDTYIQIGPNDCFHTKYLDCRALSQTEKPSVIPAHWEMNTRVNSLLADDTETTREFEKFCALRGFNINSSPASSRLSAVFAAEEAWHPTLQNDQYVQTVSIRMPTTARYDLSDESEFLSVGFLERGEQDITLSIATPSHGTITLTAKDYNNLYNNSYIFEAESVTTITISAPEEFKLACCAPGWAAIFQRKHILSYNLSLRSQLDIAVSELPVSNFECSIYTGRNMAFMKNIQLIPKNTQINIWVGYEDSIYTRVYEPDWYYNRRFYGTMTGRTFYMNTADSLTLDRPNSILSIKAQDSVALMMNRQTGDTFLSKNCTFGISGGEGKDAQISRETASGDSGRFSFIIKAMKNAALTTGGVVPVIRTSSDSADYVQNERILYEGRYMLNDPNYTAYGPYTSKEIQVSSAGAIPPSEKFIAFFPSSSPRTLLQHIMSVLQTSQRVYTSSSGTTYVAFVPTYVDAGIPTISTGSRKNVLDLTMDHGFSTIEVSRYPYYRAVSMKNGSMGNKEGVDMDPSFATELWSGATSSSQTWSNVQFNSKGKLFSNIWVEITDYTPDSSGNLQAGDPIRVSLDKARITYGVTTSNNTWFNRNLLRTYNKTYYGYIYVYDIVNNSYVSVTIGTTGMPSGGQREVKIYGQQFYSVETNTNPNAANMDDGLVIERSMYLAPGEYNLSGSSSSNPQSKITFTWRGDPRLQPRDKIYITDPQTSTSRMEATIESIETNYSEGGTVSTYTCGVASIYPPDEAAYALAGRMLMGAPTQSSDENEDAEYAEAARIIMGEEQ